MVFNPDIHHRRSIRLRGCDYSQAGMYFVTICTQGRLCLFGDVMDGAMQLNDAGRLVHEEWRNTEAMRENITLHEFIVMPNHVHGIIEIAVGARCTRPFSSLMMSKGACNQGTCNQGACNAPLRLVMLCVGINQR